MSTELYRPCLYEYIKLESGQLPRRIAKGSLALSSATFGTARQSARLTNSSSLSAAHVLCVVWRLRNVMVRMETTPCVPDGTRTRKHSKDELVMIKLININTKIHKHTEIKTRFQVATSCQFILEDSNYHENPVELHTSLPSTTCWLNPRLSPRVWNEPPLQGR